MRVIELASFDITALRRISVSLEKRLVELGANVKVVHPSDCILNQAIRLIKTYSAIPIDKQTMIYLDAAREYQNTLENVHPHEEEDILIVRLGSFTFDAIAKYNHYQVKRRVTNYMIKKINAHRPELILYLIPDMRTFIKRRVHTNNKYRVEYNLKGSAAKDIVRRAPKILEYIKTKFGINTGIINMGENAENIACDAIIETLRESGILER